MGRTDGKVVVVTGAAGGQGAAEARALAAKGATVIATDLIAPELDAAILGRALDVTDQAAWSELAEWLGERHGRVDGLVNNAGIALRTRLEEITLAELDADDRDGPRSIPPRQRGGDTAWPGGAGR